MAEIQVTLRGRKDREDGYADTLISELEELGSVDVLERFAKGWEETAERLAREYAEPVTIKLVAGVSAALLARIGKTAWRWAKAKRRDDEPGERRVIIYGPDGNPLRTVTIDDPEPEE